ncbi:MAG: hypothetical protein ACF8PN_10215 [Phycisphaerales bacterium]
MRIANFNKGLALALTAALVCGCESIESDDDELVHLPEEAPEDVSLGSILGDLTPELMTMSEREVDVEVAIARTWDTNWRNYWMDWGRLMMFDRPSRLSPYPMP